MTDAAGLAVIKPSGEIDVANVESVRRVIEPVLHQSPNRVDVALRARDLRDSRGIALRLCVATKAHSVHLRGPSVLLHRIDDANGVSDVLLIEP